MAQSGGSSGIPDANVEPTPDALSDFLRDETSTRVLVAAVDSHVVAAHIELHSNLRRSDAHRFYEREGIEMTSKYFVRIFG